MWTVHWLFTYFSMAPKLGQHLSEIAVAPTSSLWDASSACYVSHGNIASQTTRYEVEPANPLYHPSFANAVYADMDMSSAWPAPSRPTESMILTPKQQSGVAREDDPRLGGPCQFPSPGHCLRWLQHRCHDVHEPLQLEISCQNWPLK